MKALRIFLLVAIVAINYVHAQSQPNLQTTQQTTTTQTSAMRKMEVIGYATASLEPNVVYVSFSTKEFSKLGKVYSLEEQEKKLKDAVKATGYDEKNLQVMNLMGYATFTMQGEENSYEKTRFYLLKLKGINCVDKFLSNTDMKLLNNFSIESYDHDDIYAEVRKLQVTAFERGRDKADALLALYGEKRGRVLDIQEVHRYITYPATHGRKGNVHHIVSMSEGTKYIEMPTNDLHDIKVEYQVKLVFEILENDKNYK